MNPTKSNRPPYLWAGAVALAVGALYAVTLAPTTAFWDTSEYIATAHIVGIPHPPGNPLFVVLAKTWEVLLAPLGLSTAVRINLFSALMSSLAHGFWFLSVHHILRHFSENRSFRLVGAVAATVVSATAFTVWNQSNVNEKVYTVSLFTIALLTWLAFRWRERLGTGKDDNLLVLMAFILALSVGNHLMAFLAAPALAVFVLLVHPRALLNLRLYLVGVPAILLGLSIHLVLPVRSELAPIINEAQPTCEGIAPALASIATYGNAGCEDLSSALRREQYDKPSMFDRQAPLPDQVANWLQYFDWQWARGLSPGDVLFGSARLPITLLFIMLGTIGTLEHYRRDRFGWAYMAALFAVLSAGLVFYLNFRYGFAFEGRGPQEVRERDYFFVVGFSVWGLLAGLGIASLWQRLSQQTGRSLAACAPVLGLALVPLALNWQWASRSHDHSARDWAYNLLMSVEPYGLLFTNGDNDTFPLWYLQEVEGIRRDVTVAVTSYLNTDWYVKQLRELTRPCGPGEDPDADPTRILCQRPYDPDNLPAVYTHDPAAAEAQGKVPIVLDEPVRAPTRSIFPSDLDDAMIERVMSTLLPVGSLARVPLGPLVARVEAEYIFPWHQFSLAAMQNTLGDRPIYFATSGSAARSFGLRPYVIRQGLAFQLWPGDPAELEGQGVRRNTDRSALAGLIGPWVDIERTTVLADQVFVHRSGIPDDWEHWPDWSTLGIPNYYAWVYYALYVDANERGDIEARSRYQERFLAWNELGRRPVVGVEEGG